jgi:tripartite-type tricarboxylate transporter receptor subunit TctC
VTASALPRAPARPIVRRWRVARGLALALATLMSACPARADKWPLRPVTVVVPYRAGGGGETMVRLVMQQVSRSMGQPFVVENRAGAGGTIGAAYVAKEPPDGYTLLTTGVGCCVVAPTFMHTSFDALRDFTHIALFGGPPPALAVHPALAAKDLQQYIELSRRRPEGVTFATSGYGTHVHLTAELFKALSGANMLHVPYNGGGPAMADLVGGNVSSAVVSLGTVSQYVRSGQVRLLATAAPRRVRDFPDVPTFAELGYPDLTSVTWFGLSAPVGLPRDIVTSLNAEVRAAMATPAVLEKLAAEAIEPGALDADDFTRFFRAEIARWTPIASRVSASGAPAQAR